MTAMQNLQIAATEDSPEVSFLNNGQMKISGTSIVENGYEFYGGCLNWIDEMGKQGVIPPLTLRFDVYYFNTSSSRFYMEMIKKLKAILERGYEVNIIWMHEEGDEDGLEQGKDLEAVAGMTFNYEAY